jgi:hypothetical protein
MEIRVGRDMLIVDDEEDSHHHARSGSRAR